MGKPKTKRYPISRTGQLNPRQEAFVQAYMRTGKLMVAYREAGYNPGSNNTCASAACQLLKIPKIAARLTELRDKAANRAVLDTSRVLREMQRVALSDIRELLDEDGNLKRPVDWGHEAAPAVAAIESEELYSGRGPDRERIGQVKRVRFWNKTDALLNLMRYFKMIGDNAPGGNTYNTQVNYYIPSNGREVVEGSAPHHAIANGHTDPDPVALPENGRAEAEPNDSAATGVPGTGPLL